MATIVEMINPLTGLPEQVDKLDHTAQEIDDAVGLAPQLSNPNLLDNWYFGNPINQRGQTSYTGTGYGIDRWKLNGNNTIAITDGGVKFGYVNNNYVADQPLEYIADGVYTLSVLFGDNTLKYATLEVTNGQGTGEISAYRGWALAFDASMARIIHVGDDAFEITIKAVKMELGSQQTLAHQENGVWVLNEIPNYGEQLRRCQRYFWRSWTGERNTQNSILGVVFANNSRITGFDYPVEMRTKPSITVYGLTGAGKVTEFASDADYGPASPAYWDTQRCVALACDGAGLSNDNRVYYFIEANADL